VIDLSRFCEEPLKSRIVHDLASMKMSVEDRGFLPKSFYPRSQRSADKSEANGPKEGRNWDCSRIHAVGKIDVGCEFAKEVVDKPIT
jgi:hypothetical protein